MYRCALAPIVLVAGLAIQATATAQELVRRAFPAQALRGELVVTQAPELLLNGKPARLAPGARVRGVNNLIVQTGGLTGSKRVVNYTLDGNGQVFEVWLLRADEAAVAWPRSAAEAAALVFDPIAQTWSRP